MDQSVEDPGEVEDGPETAEPAAAAPELAGPVSEESAELYFLIANFLTNASQCSRAAAVLRQELVRFENSSALLLWNMGTLDRCPFAC